MSKLSTLNAVATAIVAAAALVAAGAASAQTTATPLTREAVIADLAAARSSGELATIQGEKGVEVTTPARQGGRRRHRQAAAPSRADAQAG